MDAPTSSASLSPRELRQFGLIFAAFLAGVFGGVLPLIGWIAFHAWLWAVAVTVALLALAWPRGLSPLYRVWTAIGRVLGYVNTRLLLGVVFFGVILPMGATRRAARRPSLIKSLDPSSTSYRVVRDAPPEPRHFEHPY
jgi:hypothetical protein